MKMRLKKLEISGFKSFAHKATLEFPFTINAIVGPNGSGKSNIVEAIRWVLGEQSMKHLRSKSGADLIWAGSPTKPAQGKAGVNLHFDNHDGFFPIDFEEVVIGRKVYRDGINEYYLNGSLVRLKDVAEFLARSKLGLHGHSIVNQGSVDEILKADPSERREIFEEALGLREFQLKKSEAENKLIETGQNLEKTQGLINEITPHLRSLKRQVEKWEKRELLINSLNQIEGQYFKIKINEILCAKEENEKLEESANSKIAAEKEKFEAKEKEFETRMATIAKTGSQSTTLEAEIQKLNQERHSIIREFGRLEGLIESAKRNNPQNAKTLESVLAIKIKYWFRRLNAVLDLNDEVKIKEAVKIIADEIQTISGHLEQGAADKVLSMVDLNDLAELKTDPYKKDKNELEAKLAQLDGKVRNIHSAISDVRAKENEWREHYLSFQKELELARREYLTAQEAARRFEIQKEKIKLREDDLKSEMWGSGKNYEEFLKPRFENGVFMAAEATGGAGIINAVELQNKIIKMRKEISDVGSVDEETMREYGETDKRHRFLVSEVSDLTRASDSLKELIRDLAKRINDDFKTGLVRINDEFNNYFRLMFGGGSASLKLSKEALFADLSAAETGVLINVNVPQKRVKDLDLLSGGERSLVAISLLFAIVSASQPPFLVLDEVDAALDETNALCFAKVLKNLAKDTQFVLITHNRSTMEAAEVLYGITMGDDGVSKLFSLKLTDPQKQV